tara:strand:+ start:150 stop:485 length:336 start_codon:yes stop_codon:yes gene_type:complete
MIKAKRGPSLATRPVSTMLYCDKGGRKGGVHHYIKIQKWTPVLIPYNARPEEQILVYEEYWEPLRGTNPLLPPVMKPFLSPLIVTFLVSMIVGVSIFLPLVLALVEPEAAP